MEDFEIVGLMETLEKVGHETQGAFKVVGTLVPAEVRVGYSLVPNGRYVQTKDYVGYEDIENNTGETYNPSQYDFGNTYSYMYTGHTTEEHHYSVAFRELFIEQFGDLIKAMGDSYFFLDTSVSGEVSFTVWGNSSGIIKLKKKIKSKFPESEILEVPYHEAKN